MTEVFILTLDTGSISGESTNEIVGIFAEPAKALKAWNVYLDALESKWREDEAPGPANTFNRFSEPEDDIVAFTKLERDDGYIGYYVTVTRHDVE